MSEKIEDGGPAFPFNEELIGSLGQSYHQQWFGISVRDYFAGKALVGMLSTPDVEDAEEFESEHHAVAHYSRMAYLYADAMLAERVKVKP